MKKINKALTDFNASWDKDSLALIWFALGILVSWVGFMLASALASL